MAKQSTTRHLRVVGATASPTRPRAEVEERDRAAYWARLQTLRAERQRLQVG